MALRTQFFWKLYSVYAVLIIITALTVGLMIQLRTTRDSMELIERSLQQQLATPQEARAIKAFPVPVGGFGDPDQMADWMLFMLSDAADFLCGSVVFVDGGSDAYFRADDWPRPVPARDLIGYLWRMRRFRARRR